MADLSQLLSSLNLDAEDEEEDSTKDIDQVLKLKFKILSEEQRRIRKDFIKNLALLDLLQAKFEDTNDLRIKSQLNRLRKWVSVKKQETKMKTRRLIKANKRLQQRRLLRAQERRYRSKTQTHISNIREKSKIKQGFWSELCAKMSFIRSLQTYFLKKN